MDNTSKHLGHLDRLQQTVSKIIDLVGIEEANQIIEEAYREHSLMTEKFKKLKHLHHFIISETIKEFELDEIQFLTSEEKQYRQARMACYHIIRTYTKQTYAKIGEVFGRTRRTVWYYHDQCNELLSIPQFYQEFVDKYKQIDNRTLEFIKSIT